MGIEDLNSVELVFRSSACEREARYRVDALPVETLERLLSYGAGRLLNDYLNGQIHALKKKGEIPSLDDLWIAAIARLESGWKAERTGSSVPVNPVEAKALALATEAVKIALKGKGIKQKDVDVKGLAAQALEKNRSRFEAEARKALERERGLLDDLDLDL